MTAARTALYRMYTIDRLLRERIYPTTRELAERFEVDRRTIQRDIAYMRDMLGAPIEYDRDNGGFLYSEPHFLLPAVALTIGELWALLVAERLTRKHGTASWAEQVRSVIDKLMRFVPEQLSVDITRLDQVISVCGNGAECPDGELVSRLTGAALEFRQLELIQRFHGGTTSTLVDPYHLCNSDGVWFLVGYWHTRRRICTIRCASIESIRGTGKRFKLPLDFSPKEYLRPGRLSAFDSGD